MSLRDIPGSSGAVAHSQRHVAARHSRCEWSSSSLATSCTTLWYTRCEWSNRLHSHRYVPRCGIPGASGDIRVITYAKYNFTRSRIGPRQIKQVVFCFFEHPLQYVCPHGTIVYETDSSKQMEQDGSALSFFMTD